MPHSDQNAPFFVDTEVITLTKNGLWLSDRIEIDHEQTARMFYKSLQRDDQGYFLQIGRETKRVQVEDTAYFVVGLEGSHEKGFELLLSDGRRERLDPASLKYHPERLTCTLLRGTPPQEEEAKFLHKTYLEMLRNLQEDDRSYFLTIEGQRIELAESAKKK